MTATPRTLYVHDDLSELTDDPDAARLAGRLLDLIRRDARVRVLTLAAQLEAVVAQGPHAPFALTVAIATAGERVARALHARTGWFPTIRRIEVAREENVAGGYDLATGGAGSLKEVRAIVDRSFPTEVFNPGDTGRWDEQAKRFQHYSEMTYA